MNYDNMESNASFIPDKTIYFHYQFSVDMGQFERWFVDKEIPRIQRYAISYDFTDGLHNVCGRCTHDGDDIFYIVDFVSYIGDVTYMGIHQIDQDTYLDCINKGYTLEEYGNS